MAKAGGHRPRKIRRRLVVGIALLLAAWFGRFVYLHLTLRPTPRPKYWEAKILALDPAPSGAMGCDEALAILAIQPWASEPELSANNGYGVAILRYGPWSKSRSDIAATERLFSSKEFIKARSDVKRALAAGWQEREPLHEAIAGQFSRTSFQWARCLLSHSRWARECQNDAVVAVEDWLLALRIARQERRSPVSENLYRSLSAVYGTALEILTTSNESAIDVDTQGLAREFQEALGPERPPSEYLEGLRLEYRNEIEHCYVREGGNWLSVADTAARPERYLGMTGTRASCMWNLASPVFHNFQTACRRLDDYFRSLNARTDLVKCETVFLGEKPHTEQNAPNELDGLMSMRFTDQIVLQNYRVRAAAEGALAVLAVERFHRVTGRYPESLELLVPDYLPRLPIDYADRKPLRYRREQMGYVLYSIGADGVDNLGKLPSPGPLSGPDMVFNGVRRSGIPR